MRELKNYPQRLGGTKGAMEETQFFILDMFAGAGGISCGLEQIEGFKTVLATDFNEPALKTFKYNHPDAECVLGDITDINIKEKVVNLSKKFKVNMIVGGPPCQGFSNKGKKLGLADERNFLFLEYIDMVEKIKPEIFIIENVKNMVSCADGYFINEIVTTFKNMGYNIDYRILNASNFGVPQTRERTIIIGSKSFKFDFDDLTQEEYKKVTVRDAISDLSYLNSGEGNMVSEYKNNSESDYQKMLRNVNDNKLYNHKATNHSDIALKKLALIPPEGNKSDLPKELHGNQKFKTTWSRLEWDKQSPTIDTRFDTPSNGKNSHPYLDRSITPREAARIQSFPDGYRFLGRKTEICKQIGNAVPPLLAKAIGKAIMRQINYFDKKVDLKNGVLFNGNADYVYNYLVKNNIKVDHIITDPPYVISKKNNFSTMKSAKRKGVDFGVWDEKFDLTEWIYKYSKLVKKDGSIIIFCSYRYISYIIAALEDNDFIVKDFIEWKKSNPMPRNINRRYVQDTEFAIWAVNKKAKWVFNKPEDVSYLRSSFTTPTVSGAERTIHPTQKSLEHLRHLIRVHTNEEQVILDMFMGSGTTGVAALIENRKFIGVEISEQYFEIAEKRIKNVEK